MNLFIPLAPPLAERASFFLFWLVWGSVILII